MPPGSEARVIKLTRYQAGPDEFLQIDGILTGATITELRRAVRADDGPGLVLDLDGLTALDPAGRDLLVELRGRGCRLRGGSLYVRRLLEETSS